MKKFLSILLALTIFLILSACDNDKHTLSEIETGSTTTVNVDGTDTSTETNSSNESVDSPDTSTETNSSNESAELPKSQHTHNYSVAATCTEPQKCSCGATDGTALGHEYKNFVCIRCNAEQQGDFVDLKNYFWKFGEESVNINVPGKEGMAPYTLELKILDFHVGFINNSSCVAWVDPTMPDISSVYSSPNTDVRGRIYDSKIYSATAETNYRFTYEEKDSLVKITFNEKDGGGTITFEKKGINELVLRSNTSSKLENIPVNSAFKAYPRWEIFNGV